MSSLLCRRVFSRGLTHTSSGCCCCVASTSLCLQLRASADVAVHLILVATIVQLARKQESWGDRGHAVEVAAARICREAGARVRTDVLVRDMDRSSRPRQSPLCQPSIEMGPPVAAPLRLTVLSLPKRADARAHLS